MNIAPNAEELHTNIKKVARGIAHVGIVRRGSGGPERGVAWWRFLGWEAPGTSLVYRPLGSRGPLNQSTDLPNSNSPTPFLRQEITA